MACLHPYKRKVTDPLTGKVTWVLTPCGKCENCLHEYQDMWCIRLNETAKTYKQVVYDTLTVRPEQMLVEIDFTKPTKDGFLYGTTEKYRHWKVDAMKKKFRSFHRYYPHIPYDAYKIIKKNNFKVYNFPKSEVQNWLKRGREYLTRDKGYRPDICYYICQEYGPQTSRCHYHIMFFGLQYWEYMHYFGNPWREQFGWTKPTYFQYTPFSQKDIGCITRYVSKYVTKGVYESPLVKCGLLSRPYHLISKGIGEGYLARDWFDVFKDPQLKKWMDISMPGEDTYKRKCDEFWQKGDLDGLHKYQEEYDVKVAQVKSALAKLEIDRWNAKFDPNLSMPYPDRDPDDFSCNVRPLFDHIQRLQVYYDSKGYPHKLPQYYKYKLLKKNNEKNIYQFEVQNVLQQSALLHDNQGLQRTALSLGIIIPDEWLFQDSSTWQLSPSDNFMVHYQYDVEQRSQAKAQAERRQIRLKNFYNRASQNEGAPALL